MMEQCATIVPNTQGENGQVMLKVNGTKYFIPIAYTFAQVDEIYFYCVYLS